MTMRRLVLSLALLLLAAPHVDAQSTTPISIGKVCFGKCDPLGATDESGTAATPEGSIARCVGSTYRKTDGTTSTTFWRKETGACTSSGWVADGQAVAETFTNKTLNVESTGNVVTIVEKRDFPMALAFGTSAGNAYEESGWSHNSSIACCDPTVGSNTLFGTLPFVDVTDSFANNKIWLPSDWAGTIDARLAWYTSATTGNVKWNLQTACSASTESLDPSWNTASTVTQAAQGTTNRMSIASWTSITTTGCAAGELMFFRLTRLPGDAADTLAATALAVEFELTYRRAQ